MDAKAGVVERDVGQVQEFRSSSRVGVTKYGDGGSIRGRFAFEKRADPEGGDRGGGDGAASLSSSPLSCRGEQEPVRLDARTVEGCATNGTVCLTDWPPVNDPDFERRTRPTRDPADLAHRCLVQRDNVPILSPQESTRRGVGTPRRYPHSQLTSTGVAFDSAFDGLHAAHRRLAGDGMDVVRHLGGTARLESLERLIDATAEQATRKEGLSDLIDRNAIAFRICSAEALLKRYQLGIWKPER